VEGEAQGDSRIDWRWDRWGHGVTRTRIPRSEEKKRGLKGEHKE
jgi:hypothetical protein